MSKIFFGESIVFGNFGNVYRNLGEYARAKAYLEEALRLIHKFGNRQWEGTMMASLSLLLHCQKDHDNAYKIARQTLDILYNLGERSDQGYILTILGYMLVRSGKLTETAEMYQQSFTLRRKLGQYHLAVEPVAGLANIFFIEGDLVQAIKNAQKILDYPETHPQLDGVEEPLLICYRVLQTSSEPRVQDVLKAAWHLLDERAA